MRVSDALTPVHHGRACVRPSDTKGTTVDRQEWIDERGAVLPSLQANHQRRKQAEAEVQATRGELSGLLVRAHVQDSLAEFVRLCDLKGTEGPLAVFKALDAMYEDEVRHIVLSLVLLEGAAGTLLEETA